jgi:uncharacterized protein YjbI with pentapeptide repeats
MLILKLTRAEIAEKNACADGLALFDEIAPDGLIETEWTPLHALWLAAGSPGYAGWLREVGLVPAVYLRYANLRYANLRGADLSDADLSGADLSDADLRGAIGYTPA